MSAAVAALLSARGSPLATRCSRAMASSANSGSSRPASVEVVAQVGGGFGEVHRLDGEPGGDPLVEGGEDAHPQLPVQGGLPGEDPGERGGGIHLGVGQEPQFLELVRLQEMGLVADEHDPAVPFCGLGGEQVAGLGHQLGLEVAGPGAECPDDGDIQARGCRTPGWRCK